jgi:hypothetical protein
MAGVMVLLFCCEVSFHDVVYCNNATELNPIYNITGCKNLKKIVNSLSYEV